MSKYYCPPLSHVSLIHLHFDFVHVVHTVVFLCFILVNRCRIQLRVISCTLASSRLLIPVDCPYCRMISAIITSLLVDVLDHSKESARNKLTRPETRVSREDTLGERRHPKGYIVVTLNKSTRVVPHPLHPPPLPPPCQLWVSVQRSTFQSSDSSTSRGSPVFLSPPRRGTQAN